MMMRPMVLLEPRKRHRFYNVFAEAGFTASAQVLFHAEAAHCNAFDRWRLVRSQSYREG